jgi:cytochrome c oxidase subunit IV
MREELRRYTLTWLALLALLAATVASTALALGPFKPVANLGLAALKAALVLTVFMELRHAGVLTRVFALAGAALLAVLIGLSLADLLTRGGPG